MKLIKFWADWCAPRHKTEPIFAELECEFGDRLEFVRVNIDEQAEMAMMWNIQSVPTLLLVDGDDELVANLTHLPAFKTGLRSLLVNTYGL